jgi:hypothetical protein
MSATTCIIYARIHTHTPKENDTLAAPALKFSNSHILPLHTLISGSKDSPIVDDTQATVFSNCSFSGKGSTRLFSRKSEDILLFLRWLRSAWMARCCCLLACVCARALSLSVSFPSLLVGSSSSCPLLSSSCVCVCVCVCVCEWTVFRDCCVSERVSGGANHDALRCESLPGSRSLLAVSVGRLSVHNKKKAPVANQTKNTPCMHAARFSLSSVLKERPNSCTTSLPQT